MQTKYVRDLKHGDRVLMESPTGSGKVTSCKINPLYVSAHGPVYEVVVWRDDLMKEASTLVVGSDEVAMFVEPSPMTEAERKLAQWEADKHDPR